MALQIEVDELELNDVAEGNRDGPETLDGLGVGVRVVGGNKTARGVCHDPATTCVGRERCIITKRYAGEIFKIILPDTNPI